MSVFRNKAAGVVIDGAEAVVATVASGLTGPGRPAVQRTPLGDGGAAAAQRNRLAAAEKVFFLTRRQPEGGDAVDCIPLSLLARGVVYDDVTFRIGGDTFQSVAACTLEVAESAQGAAALVATPLAHYRAAVAVARVPREWKTAVRILLRGADGLAILEGGRRALAWRTLRCPAGAEIYAVGNAIRGLQAHACADLELPGVDGVLIHAADGEGLAAKCREHFGVETRVAPVAGPDPETAAVGLALEGLRRQSPDLLRGLKPHDLRRFPMVTALVFLLLVAIGGFMLWERARAAEKAATALGEPPTDLDERLEALRGELAEAEAFLARRIFWAPMLAELPELLPQNAVVTALFGQNRVPVLDPVSEERLRSDLLTVRFKVTVPQGESYPREPRVVADAMAASASFTGAFKEISGRGVVRNLDHALFSVIGRNP